MRYIHPPPNELLGWFRRNNYFLTYNTIKKSQNVSKKKKTRNIFTMLAQLEEEKKLNKYCKYVLSFLVFLFLESYSILCHVLHELFLIQIQKRTKQFIQQGSVNIPHSVDTRKRDSQIDTQMWGSKTHATMTAKALALVLPLMLF